MTLPKIIKTNKQINKNFKNKITMSTRSETELQSLRNGVFMNLPSGDH